MASTSGSSERVFLEGDDEIRGQKFICLSFLSPEAVLKNKDRYFFSKFLKFYAMDYKIRATESFLMKQIQQVQNVLSDVETIVDNERLSTEASTDPAVKQVGKNLSTALNSLVKAREQLSRSSAEDLETHVKSNMSDFSETAIEEAYEKYMIVNRQKLEDEFHKENNFRTSIRGLKCRGAYGSYEQAVARAQQLSKKDPYFNVYVAEMGEWLPWDPEPSEVPNQQYQNEQLNKLMQAYKENAAKKDAFFEEEKRQKMAEAAAAAKAAKKPAVFGEKGKEEEAAVTGREIFDAMAEDMTAAIAARKAEGSSGGSSSAAESDSVIQHQ